MKAELGKFKKEMHRLEVEVPKDGNEFVGAPMKAVNGTGPGAPTLQMRITGGHSFLNGHDGVVFFDGEMDLEFRFLSHGYPAKITSELTGPLLSGLQELFPDRYLAFDRDRHVTTLGLMIDTETPIDKSSQVLLTQLADRFGIQKEPLLNQAKWCLRIH